MELQTIERAPDAAREQNLLSVYRGLIIEGNGDGKGGKAFRRAALRFVETLEASGSVLSEDSIRTYFRSLETQTTPDGKPWSASTVQHHRQAVRNRMRCLMREMNSPQFTALLSGALANIEATDPPPKREKKLGDREQFLSRQDVAALKAAANTERQRLLIETLWITGARVAEMCDMRKAARKEAGDGFTYAVTGKGGKERFLFVPAHLHARILEAFNGSEYLFTTERGGRFDPDYVSRLVRRVGARIGKRISAHTMRHSIATHHLKQNETVEAVRDFLGHSDISTTMIYLHDEISHQRRALAAV